MTRTVATSVFPSLLPFFPSTSNLDKQEISWKKKSVRHSFCSNSSTTSSTSIHRNAQRQESDATHEAHSLFLLYRPIIFRSCHCSLCPLVGTIQGTRQSAKPCADRGRCLHYPCALGCHSSLGHVLRCEILPFEKASETLSIETTWNGERDYKNIGRDLR